MMTPLAIFLAIVAAIAIAQNDPFDLGLSTDTPAYVEAAPMVVPADVTDAWPTRRGGRFTRIEELVKWVSCERDEDEWWVVGYGSRVGVFKQGKLRFNFLFFTYTQSLGPIFVKIIPFDVNSPYSELRTLNVGELSISRDLAARLLAPQSSGSCTR